MFLFSIISTFIGITSEDKNKEISKNNLDKVELNELGNYVYSRDTISNIKAKGIPKKVVEDTYLSLCEEKGKPFWIMPFYDREIQHIYHITIQKRCISFASNFCHPIIINVAICSII